MKVYIASLCFFIASPVWLIAQEVLTPEQAIAIALKTNYDITISRSQLEISENNNSKGNAGFLPSLNANVSGSTSDNSFKQNLSSGVITTKDHVNSNSLVAGAQLSWTVFDGFKMFATYEKLKTLNAIGETQLKIQIENTIATTLSTYYDVVINKQDKVALEKSIALYSELVKISEQKYKIGLASKVDYLQVKVDFNAIRSAYLQKDAMILNTKNSLNELIGRPVDTPFDVIDTIIVDQRKSLEELMESVKQQNTLLKYNEQNVLVTKRAMQEIAAARYPKLSLNAGYNYSRSQSEAGFMYLNQLSGPTIGFTATWNIFNGGILNTQIRNTHVQMDIAEITLEQSKRAIERRLNEAWNNAAVAYEVLALEEENFLLAKENVFLGLERYKVGSGTPVQISQAYLSYVTAQNRLLQARHTAKMSEIELKKLNGELVK
jgi:outer membrane protein